jgi:hypothetical protein
MDRSSAIVMGFPDDGQQGTGSYGLELLHALGFGMAGSECVRSRIGTVNAADGIRL